MNIGGWKLTVLVLGGVAALAGGVFVGTLFAHEPAGGLGVGQTTDASGQTTVTGDGGSPTTATTRPATANPDCDLPAGEPFVGGPATPLMELGEANRLSVEAALYPHPAYDTGLWTQWGQGLALEDGRFYSAIGDHLGVDGNSYVYEYDPTSGVLSMVGDLLSYVDHEPGSWGYGKVHGQMVAGSCGEIYFSSYWGTSNDLEFSGSYTGDILFRLDPAARTIQSLGVSVDAHGVPSLAGSAANGLVYGEAIDPLRTAVDIDEGPFFVYDTTSDEVIFEGPSMPHMGFRNILVDGSGRAFYSIGNSQLAVYDPATNDVGVHTATLPDVWLRASTVPADDGRVYGVTEDPARFFVMDPTGEITSLGDSRGYTTSMALHPDGDRFFYMPDAHGVAWLTGAPVIAVDTTTGEETVVAELNSLVESAFGLRVGGTYDMSVAPSGDALYIGVNVGPLDDDFGFGDVALVIVHLR